MTMKFSEPLCRSKNKPIVKGRLNLADSQEKGA